MTEPRGPAPDVPIAWQRHTVLDRVEEQLPEAEAFWLRLARNLVTSQRYRQAEIERRYSSYLGRAPTTEELADWLSRLEDPAAILAEIDFAILQTAEYAADSPDSVAFTRRVLGQLLGPAGDPLARLALEHTGGWRLQLVANLLATEEWRRSAVTGYYRRLLGRDPDPLELEQATRLATGSEASRWSGEPAIVTIAGSQEYLARACPAARAQIATTPLPAATGPALFGTATVRPFPSLMESGLTSGPHPGISPGTPRTTQAAASAATPPIPTPIQQRPPGQRRF